MTTMTEQEMQALAEKLIEMKVNKARGYTRRLDPDNELVLLRVGVGSEILTRYRLPNKGVMVTLVEKAHTEAYVEENTNLNFHDRLRSEPEFVEARVVALDS